MEKKLNPNSEEFYKKYGFRSTVSMPHPVHKDLMTFEGLEADYVNFLEREIEHYKTAYMREVELNQRIQMREYYRLNDEIKKLKGEFGES